MKTILIAFFLLVTLSGCSQYSEPQPKVINGNSPNNGQEKPGDQIEEPLEATFSSIKLNIINKKCLSCHRPGGKAQDIPLTKESDLLTGSIDEGPLVVPGDAAKSIFYKVMQTDPKIRGSLKLMPKQKDVDAGLVKAVTPEEMQVVAAWINGIAGSGTTNCPAPNPLPNPNPPPPNTSPGSEPTPEPPATIDFAYIKSQILDKKCSECHKAGGKAEDYAFDSKEKILKYSNELNEPYLIPGKALKSMMYLSLLTDEDIRQDVRKMPPPKAVNSGKVKDITVSEVKIIETWINSGAP